MPLIPVLGRQEDLSEIKTRLFFIMSSSPARARETLYVTNKCNK